MPAPSPQDILQFLRRAQVLKTAEAELVPLTGGVSSEIYLVRDGAARLVVKRALAKLRVRDDWFADTSRNRTEADFFKYVAAFAPAVIPRLIAEDAGAGWFAMEYIADGARPWKEKLLRGEVDPDDAARAGATLGLLHRQSWGDPAAAARFATDANFSQLRIEPYLETAAQRLPDLGRHLREAAAELRATKLALVHGDFSPKNILVSPRRFVLLDAEVAWFGDPAFDSAFVLTHLYLKARAFPHYAGRLMAAAQVFRGEYAGALGVRSDQALEARSVRLQLCLMLARIAGKSPVEYLDAEQARHVSDFIHEHLPTPPASHDKLARAWSETLPVS